MKNFLLLSLMFILSSGAVLAENDNPKMTVVDDNGNLKMAPAGSIRPSNQPAQPRKLVPPSKEESGSEKPAISEDSTDIEIK